MGKYTWLNHYHLDKHMNISWSWRNKKNVEQVLLQNNCEDMRLSENKVSHECETPKGKVSAIKDKFEGFNQNKK